MHLTHSTTIWLLLVSLLTTPGECLLPVPTYSGFRNMVSSSLTFLSISTGHHVADRRNILVLMGKGDGKKRRKKKAANSSTSSSSTGTTETSASSPPQRVTNQINISVRQQIRYAQMHKQAARAASTGFRQKRVQRTAYRRSWDEEEIELKAEERRRRGQEPDWDVILNRTASAPLVIVDGYNVIHKWPRLKKHMTKGDPQRARQLLVDDLENLRSLKGWRVEVVFDGTKRSLVGPLGQGPEKSQKVSPADQASRKEVTKFGVRAVFTGVGIEADTYIERRCAEARNITKGTLTSSFIVVSDDTMIRLAGQGAGAHCMGSGRFVDELKAARRGIEYQVEAAVARVNGHAVRPGRLRKIPHSPTFGRRSVLIVDKRNQTKSKPKQQEEAPDLEYDLNLEVEEDNGIPWWAQVPNQTNPYKS